MLQSNQPHRPMSEALLNALRCGARTKSRQGQPCKAPSMANGRCRVHGGPSTGPRTPEGLERSRRARWKHGRRSAEAIAERRMLALQIALAMRGNQKARETFKISERK